ncbi:MAG: hypothetical protein IPF88_14170 [Candidatus Microthrix sp.]|nr:hypothetical protein [Candidatus Microthrix sp.]MBK6439692.1 hypothetical protein [Candidatus Microthrix sp.]
MNAELSTSCSNESMLSRPVSTDSLASRAVRAQRRVRSTPALTNAYRGLLGALGRR